MQVLKSLEEPSANYKPMSLDAMARCIFWAGVAASALDALFTFLVIKRVGIQIEANKPMALLMQLFGPSIFCIFRVIIGVTCFWGLANIIRGRRYFYTNWGRRRYSARLERTSLKWYQFLWPHRHLTVAIEATVGLVLTWAVVGNDFRAFITIVVLHR